MLGEADGFPVNYNYNYFPLRRIPGLAKAFEAAGRKPVERFSLAELLKSAGIVDPRRKTIRIRSRPPTREEAHWLKMPATGHVLLTDVVQVDAKKQARRIRRDLLQRRPRFAGCGPRAQISLDP